MDLNNLLRRITNMKVELIKQLFDNTCSYKIKKMDWCCDDLKENPIINLYSDYDLIPLVGIEEECEIDYDGWTDYRHYPIKFCPLCGKPVEVFVVAEKDVSEEYKALCKERDTLWEKVKQTDSKKKEIELRNKVDNLDRKINWYYSLVAYDEWEEKEK